MRVRDRCENRLGELAGFAWPPHLECDNYPTREEDRLCFGLPDPTTIDITQSVLNRLGVTHAPSNVTGFSPTGPGVTTVTGDE